MKLQVFVEKTEDGYYGATQNIPGVIVANGKSFQEMKRDLLKALEFYKEDCDEDTKVLLNRKIEFVYRLDLHNIFKVFKEINKSKFAERIGINPSLFRQYTNNKNIYMSEKRLNKIQIGFYELGAALQNIKL